MGGTSIDDQENRTCGAGDEALEKFNKDSGIDTALFLDHEPHRTALVPFRGAFSRARTRATLMGRHGLPVGVATPRALSTSAALRVLRAAVSTNMARSTSARSAAATLLAA